MSKDSATFSRPPLDGTLTVDQLTNWNRVHSPNATAFVFPSEGSDHTHLTWKAFDEAVTKGTDIIRRHIPELQVGTRLYQYQEPVVVGILALTDTISYTTLLYSLMKFTHSGSSRRRLVPFPISTRNSPAALAHLVRVTGVKYLWITEGDVRTIVNEVLNQGGLGDTVLLQIPSFSELYSGSSSVSSLDNDDDGSISLDQAAIILHSSGSTAYPKPHTWTHRILLESSNYFVNSEMGGLDAQHQVMAVHASPLFHAMGLLSALWSAASGIIRAVPSPRIALRPMTPEGLLDDIVKSNSSLVFCVPSFLEAWSLEPRSVKVLAKMKGIFWGGAPMKTDVGRFLRSEDVPILALFGGTEFGPVSFVPAKPHAEGHEWFKFSPNISPEFVPEEGEEGVYELVFKECETHHLSAHNTEVNGVPAYASNDLVERHPFNPELFRIKGRKDDQIMLSTGEKTNPGPLELIISNNIHVKSAIMFGRGRLFNGVIVEPASFEAAEKQGLQNFRNLIWSSIEEANKYAPAHSRIFKEMILVASAAKPFSYTAKQGVKRGAILNDYAEEIDSVYSAVEEFSNADIPIPVGSSIEGGWTLEEALVFVRKAVHIVMTDAEELEDNDDLFGFGCDSLQATYIRNTILHALRQIAAPANVQKAPSNFVYQNPTISELAAFASQVSHSTAAAVELNLEVARSNRLQAFVNKYTQNWPVHRPSKNGADPTDETILLTGSTGGLGSQILAQLVAMPTVSRIYAFNRPARDGKNSHDRQLKAFLDRGNDVGLVDSEKIVYVEGDTAVEGFNIKEDLFKEIRDSVTTIILNAWRVDFNISLSSFEPAIRGVRYMVDLALQSPHSSPPRVMFTSSIGNIKAWSYIPPVTESPVSDLTLINTSGYSESKWVSERLLWSAGQLTALRPIVVRVGQLSGGINGNWNTREWFPALTRASQVVGGVPNNGGLVSFIPLHVAAAALIELRHTSSQYVHLVHPRPVPWSNVIQYVADALHLPVLPYDEWLHRLEALPKSDEALYRNPALHLLDFYQVSATPTDAQQVGEREAMGVATYETNTSATEAASLIPTRLPLLGRDDVDNWIHYWKSKGALD